MRLTSLLLKTAQTSSKLRGGTPKPPSNPQLRAARRVMFTLFNPNGTMSKVRLAHLRLVEQINKLSVSYAKQVFIIPNASGTPSTGLSGGLNIIEYRGLPPEKI